jgi:hypothetical protein
MQQIVATDHLRVGIGKNAERIARFFLRSRETSGGSTLIATGRTPADLNSLSRFSIPRNSRLQNGHQYPR